MDERLRLFKLEKNLREQGEELSPEDKKKKSKNRRMKVYNLNKHVFESMANLITFFEYTSGWNAELREEFEEDMKELLFDIGHDDGKGVALIRFIHAAMEWNWETEKGRDNFRFLLLDQMQWLIVSKIMALSLREFGDDMTNQVTGPDMFRAWNWVKLYARGASRADKIDMADPSRPGSFLRFYGPFFFNSAISSFISKSISDNEDIASAL